MKQKTVTIIVALAVLVFLVLLGLSGFTVVKIEDEEKIAQNEEFDPVTYVDSVWTSKVLPPFAGAVGALSAILAEIQPDAEGTISKDDLIATTGKYGLITVGESHVYMVKGAGKVVNVEAATSKAAITVALNGYSGPIKVLIYVGTRVSSDDTTAVRDAVGITLNDGFKDQTEFGKAASEITRRTLAEMGRGLDVATLMGKTISFRGAFTIPTFNRITIVVKEISVVPIEIKVDQP